MSIDMNQTFVYTIHCILRLSLKDICSYYSQSLSCRSSLNSGANYQTEITK